MSFIIQRYNQSFYRKYLGTTLLAQSFILVQEKNVIKNPVVEKCVWNILCVLYSISKISFICKSVASSSKIKEDEFLIKFFTKYLFNFRSAAVAVVERGTGSTKLP